MFQNINRNVGGHQDQTKDSKSSTTLGALSSTRFSSGAAEGSSGFANSVEKTVDSFLKAADHIFSPEVRDAIKPILTNIKERLTQSDPPVSNQELAPAFQQVSDVLKKSAELGSSVAQVTRGMIDDLLKRMGSDSAGESHRSSPGGNQGGATFYAGGSATFDEGLGAAITPGTPEWRKHLRDRMRQPQDEPDEGPSVPVKEKKLGVGKPEQAGKTEEEETRERLRRRLLEPRGDGIEGPSKRLTK